MTAFTNRRTVSVKDNIKYSYYFKTCYKPISYKYVNTQPK